ncbi:hypothetical protein Ancab_011104 [Ancistrocladus abbreviatus]
MEDHHNHQSQHRMERKSTKLSLDKYLSFFHSSNDFPLSVSELNQKAAVVEAVSTIELTDPSRSTLSENISSQAFITLDEVIRDLADLKWHECPVSSIKTLYSTDYTTSTNTHITAADMGAKSPLVKAKKRKSSWKQLLTLGCPDISASDSFCLNGSPFGTGEETLGTSSCSSSAAGGCTQKLKEKRRRRVRLGDRNNEGDGRD